MTDRQKAAGLLKELRDLGFQDSNILEHLIFNWLSGSEACEALEDYANEVDQDLDA